MRTMRTELRAAMLTLLVLASITAQLNAEERASAQRRRALQLNAVTGLKPIKGEVLALLADEATAKKLLAEAARMTQEKPQPFNYNAALILASTAAQLDDYRAAETFYRLYMDQAKRLLSVKGLVTAYSGLIDAVYGGKKYAEAEKLCKEALNLPIDEPDDESGRHFQSAVLQELIRAIAHQGDTKRAIDIIDRLYKNQPKSWAALELKAGVYRIAEKHQEAIDSYLEEIELINKDDKLKEKERDSLIEEVRYLLSGAYVDVNQIDNAAEQLQKLLARHPKNPTYNNDLGYIWADHDKNLAESEKLIRKAIDEERKRLKGDKDKVNPAYLDSLGWVLFKQKKYEEAKKCLQQAVEQKAGDHIEILDHLAEVQMALGEKAEAVATWKKGVAAAGDSKREQKRKAEVLKKIKANE